MLRRMAVIRDFETAVEGLIDKGELVGSIHTSSGQEAVCVGAAMAVAKDDLMTGHHRSHGHPIGKGAPIDALMAELFGKRSGVCKGMGGSMHLADFSVGSLGETAIVASGLPIAVGAALAVKLQGWTKVVIAFFGEGASNAGAFHEALNMAAVWKLPVVFVCENNKYAVTTTYSETSSVEKVSDRAVGYNVRAEVVDGQDVIAVWRRSRPPLDRARAGGGPEIVEAMTYRYGEHSYLMSNRGPYRSDEEIDEWRKKDPIPLFGDRLVKAARPRRTRSTRSSKTRSPLWTALSRRPVPTSTRRSTTCGTACTSTPVPSRPAATTPSGPLRAAREHQRLMTHADDLAAGGQRGRPRRDGPRRAGVRHG
jgi:pyruvate dehydrogenase E1 component alpha subunit